MRVRVEGQLTFNNTAHMLNAAVRDLAWRMCRKIPSQDEYRKRHAGAGAGRLVPVLPGLSPLLPQPPAAYAGFCFAGGCVALSGVKERWLSRRRDPKAFFGVGTMMVAAD